MSTPSRTPYELAQAYAAGDLSRAEIIDQLARYPYDPAPTTDGYDSLTVDAPGTHTFNEVHRALRQRLLDPTVYEEILSVIETAFWQAQPGVHQDIAEARRHLDGPGHDAGWPPSVVDATDNHLRDDQNVDAEPLSPEARRQLQATRTSLHRLLTGTLLPHHDRAPDDVEVDAMIIETETYIAMLDRLLEHDP